MEGLMLGLLSGSFDQTDPAGLRVVFRFPPLLAANARPAMVLDPGDGTAPISTDNTGKITHVYTSPAIVTATLTDADGNPCGRARFEVPRATYGPWNIGAAACY
jgi:hypothetical protein